jgi:vitamin B12 transporter
MICNRLVAFVFVLFAHFVTFAQTDTIINLTEIEIYGDRYSAFSTANKTQKLDSSDVATYKSSDLSSILKTRSGVFIKGYGPGMLATPSLRGSSASQTALLWNGFNIQSPMHGQNDLSLFPVAFSDAIQIQHGGTGSIWGSGAIGGAISLNNSTDFDGKIHIESEAQSGTTENHTQLLNFRISGEKLSTTLRIFNLNANNKFDYINPYTNDSIIQTRQNSSVIQKGVLNEIYYRNGKNNFAVVRFWYQNNERNIPPTLLQSNTGAFQKDETIRITASWQKAFSKTLAKLQTAYFDETIFYQDSIGTESLSKAKTYIQEIDYRILNFRNHSINIGANNNIVSAESNHYPSNLTINRFAVFSAWKWNNKPSTLSFFASARKEWQQKHEIPFVPSFGFSYFLTKDISVKGNVGKSFRMPSVNDLYWVPGGNPDLLPESGWSQDLSFIFDKQMTSEKDKNSLHFSRTTFSITGFHRKIDNWIIWLPQSGLWTPQNIMEVRSKGLEFENSYELKSKNSVYNLRLFYDYISSENEKQKSPNDASVGKQLIYTPQHSMRALFSATYKSIGFYYENSLVGKRYTSSDNLEWLEPYNISNTGVSYSFNYNNWILTSGFEVQNIFNSNYMIVVGNPMPLRYYQVKINLKYWNRLKKQMD